ncbi:XRE family transcriptional regulator [Streptomyces sp. NPDC042319]|uniref:XRE family transcriptional regulator n=1 Tax=Streptomyces sp. NPDC042319 TaxID=3154332 RepID=UPI0033EA45B6
MRDERLEPEGITEVAAFMAGLRRLRALSGLTFRELARRAESEGRTLPASTLAAALGREKLPRAEVVEGLVRACGCPPDTVAAWLATRSRLACPGPETPASTASATAPDQGTPADATTAVRRSLLGLRRRTGTYIAAAGVATAVTLGLVLYAQTGSAADGADDTESGRTAALSETTAPLTRSASVPEGKYLIRAAHSGLCLAERVGEGSGQVHQDECANAIPDYALERFPDGTYQILSQHPEFGPGCMGVTDRRTSDLAPVADDFCGRRGPAERFVLERVDDTAVTGTAKAGLGTSPDNDLYRLRPRHSQKCLGFTPSATSGGREGQPLLQLSCDPKAEGQLFAFDPVT